MKWSLRGLARLKPFDELLETPKAGAIYVDSAFFTVAVITSSVLAISALALALAGSRHAFVVLGCAIGLSAITAGGEWHAGLRARALNQLFTAVLAALLFGLLGD